MCMRVEEAIHYGAAQFSDESSSESHFRQEKEELCALLCH